VNNVEFLGMTLDVVGKVMVAVMAIRVHWRFRKEHKIDEAVFTSMRREQKMGLIGVFLMITGWLLEIGGRI
jgi:hypothetical protein